MPVFSGRSSSVVVNVSVPAMPLVPKWRSHRLRLPRPPAALSAADLPRVPGCINVRRVLNVEGRLRHSGVFQIGSVSAAMLVSSATAPMR